MADNKETGEEERGESPADLVDDALADLAEIAEEEEADAASRPTPSRDYPAVAAAEEDEADATAVYTFTADESPPGDPKKSVLYSPGMEENWEGPLPRRSHPKVFLITAVAVLVVVGVFFAVLPGDMRTDAMRLMTGHDIIEEREMRAAAQREAERQAILDAAPRYGTIEIVTIPNNLLVLAEGQDQLIFPGTRRDMVVPTRSRVVYQDVSVTEPFIFTIQGEGVFQDRRVEIHPHGHPDTEWVQRFSGEYTATVTYTMDALPDQAREVAWRRGFRPADWPDRDFLKGTITVNTEPEGAAIAYNGILLLDENGNPATTPFTFSQHPAPPNAEDQSPRDVYLSREGMRIELLLDGYVRTAFGVHAHQYRCTPKEGADWPADDAEDPDFYDLCDYTYEVTVPLMEPPPEEEGEEGEEGEGDDGAEDASADEDGE
ncbi:MAG: hypothetical protein EA398_16850 [Deltaproteobacteria bacterium]|nr:MAG: hypothetical protein EA398_16850 [Deltaproteobacteria bacterium]